MSGNGQASAVDALTTAAIADATATGGVSKADLAFGEMTSLALLAGVYIGFGGLAAMVALAGAEGQLAFGAAQLLAGLAFSLGLILVLLAGAELFTGNTLLIMAWAQRQLGLLAMLRALALVYAGNFIGSLLLAAGAFAAAIHLAGDGAVGIAALGMADAKVKLAFVPALFSGILANMLVCLAVWMANGARSAADKLLVIIAPITAFVALGLEHSIANMFIIPFAWAVRMFAGPEFWAIAGASAGHYADITPTGFMANLVPVTIGNLIGGFSIGAAYWFACLRRSS